MSSPAPFIPPDVAASVTPNWHGFWAEFFASAVENLPTGLEINKGAIGSLIADVAAVLVELSIEITAEVGKRVGEAVDEFEAQAGPTILAAAARGIGDYFGVAVSVGDIDPARGFSDRYRFAEQLGRLTLENMFGAFSVPGPLSPDDGATNAERIIGFNIATALESWIGKVTTTTPLTKWIPNWADLDDVLSANLGLGRANRRVIGPLLKTLVVDPFTWDLNRRFTPQQFSETQLVRALNRRLIDQATYFEQMSWLGWDNNKASKLQSILSTTPGKEDIARMLELGLLTEERAKALFEAAGFTEGAAEAMLRVALDDRVRSINTAIESTARDLFRDREIEEPELRALLKSAGRTPEEIEAFSGLALLERSRSTRLPRGVIEQGFREGLITLSRLSEYYEQAGYSVEDRVLLEELAVADRIATQARDDALQLRAKGSDFLQISRGQLEQAFIEGIVGAERLRAYYTEKGYGPDDAAVLFDLAARRKTERDRKLEAALAKAREPAFTELPRATVEEAFIRDVIGESRLRAWYEAAGFRAEDLELLVATARQKKAERADKLKDQLDGATGARFAELPRSVIEEAYFRGIIGEDRLRAWYEARGFRPGEVPILLELARERKADRAGAAAPA